MTNRNSLLGRSKPRGKLTREEIAALDEATVPPVQPAKPPGKKGGGTQRMVRSGWSYKPLTGNMDGSTAHRCAWACTAYRPPLASARSAL